MNAPDLDRLKRVAEMIDTRERSELALLIRQADAHRSELQRIKIRLAGVEGSQNLLAGEAFRSWCRRMIETETAALRDVEASIQNQMNAVASTSARKQVLETLAMEDRKARQKKMRVRELEASSRLDERYRERGRP